jgi:hypothetical protein
MPCPKQLVDADSRCKLAACARADARGLSTRSTQKCCTFVPCRSEVLASVVLPDLSDSKFLPRAAPMAPAAVERGGQRPSSVCPRLGSWQAKHDSLTSGRHMRHREHRGHLRASFTWSVPYSRPLACSSALPGLRFWCLDEMQHGYGHVA